MTVKHLMILKTIIYNRIRLQMRNQPPKNLTKKQKNLAIMTLMKKKLSNRAIAKPLPHLHHPIFHMALQFPSLLY
ncbi:unnamed protein product [Hymenolepis diminuta]|uniref:Uncharacterized protein n=1 Tax=Hymenolepis diminuta TaxID=6216 RepID=A0A564YC52_HYMDI|nr:unnamed protein product [Hymenolepis diminuta]VUZ42174.1 unnamed protein product [Hymenolepis diminuta]VUZ44559.1 unnamed protein product [Hymenolepis diminuta]